jgi:hypothetical protein
MERVIICLALIIYLSIISLWKKPTTDFGKQSLKLCLVNAGGWFVVLLSSNRGHPPPSLLTAVLFAVMNLGVLPATFILLWRSRREGEERLSYLVLASIYMVINIIMIYVVPVVMIVKGAR